ncbi:MAG: response regulator [Campylobacterales bacterium]|nr:response regulator [Campylobacterales bacterium]
MKIVVLDDSTTVLLTMEALLEELGVKEEEMFLFNDGQGALDFIEQNGADIIISDIQMPGMDGFAFVQKLLAVSRRFVSTLFVVSAYENFRDIDRMKGIGAKRFIKKPINAKLFNHFVAPEIAKCRVRKKSQKTAEAAEQSLVAKAEVLDFEQLAVSMGINARHIPRLMQSFLGESQQLCEKLEAAIAEKNYTEIEHAAHTIKGSAGNMQFMRLYEMAKLLEFAAEFKDETFAYAEYNAAIKAELAAITRRLPDAVV